MDVKELLELIGVKRQSNVDAVNTAQILMGNEQARKSMETQARINAAVQNAFWKSKCGEDYEAPEEDMGNNFINCSITSEAAVRQLAALVNDGNTPAPPDTPQRQPKPWWRWLVGLLMALILGAVTVWLSLYFFQNPDAVRTELIAIPFNPER